MVASTRIAVFGGSFDPPHIGHMEICRYVLKQGFAERVLVVPCWKHPFAKTLAGYDDRLAMCNLAFGSLQAVEISEIERELGSVSHTVRTLDTLSASLPGAQFALVIGSDLAEEMKSWRDADELCKKAKVITIPRGPNGPIPDVSATEVREQVAKGKSVAGLVPASVANYIASHKLYCP